MQPSVQAVDSVTRCKLSAVSTFSGRISLRLQERSNVGDAWAVYDATRRRTVIIQVMMMVRLSFVLASVLSCVENSVCGSTTERSERRWGVCGGGCHAHDGVERVGPKGISLAGYTRNGSPACALQQLQEVRFQFALEIRVSDNVFPLK